MAQPDVTDHALTKITSGVIVAASGEAWGCSRGDYDYDGFIDLFVTNSRSNALFRNNGEPNLSEEGLSLGGGTRAWRRDEIDQYQS